MDSALFNALKRQSELRDELNEIDRFIRLYNKFKSAGSPQQSLKLDEPEPEHDAEQKESIAVSSGDMESAKPQNNSFTPPPRGYTKEMLKPHLRDVIKDANKPLSRSQLLRALDARRIPVGGSNRPKNMGTIMWRLSDDFVNLDGFGYWPREEPYAPAGYDPSAPQHQLDDHGDDQPGE